MKRKVWLLIGVFISTLFAAQEVVAQTIVSLDVEKFREQVWNYDKNPDRWVYEGELPCVIDFSATWCGPCRRMEPILENLALKYNGKVVIYQVDVDKSPQLASMFGVSSVPAFLFCPVGGQPRGTVGGYPAEEFENLIKTLLLGEK